MKKTIISAIALLLIAVSALFLTGHSLAACGGIDQGVTGGIACGPAAKSAPEAIKTTINVLLYIVGIAAVIVIIVGGLRYVLSGGDPKNTAAAKDTIMYAAIGLAVSVLAYGIVNFVLSQFK